MSGLGVIVVHGLGGTPHSVLPVTAAAHGAGYATVAPMLAGHGTTPTDLADHSWADWVRTIAATADELSLRSDVDGLVLVGQSLGATLALHLAATQRSDIRGIAVINGLALPADPDAVEHIEHLLERGRTMQPAEEPDIRDPDARDSSYPELSLRALLEMSAAADAAGQILDRVTVPVLVASSTHDAVVDPANSDAIAAGVSGPVRRLHLLNSAHVAALDLDREQLCRELLIWLADLTDGSAVPG